MSTEASDRPSLTDGPRDRTKKIRLTGAEEELLAELARHHDTSQSEVLRRGLRAIDRMRRRRENIEGLIELAEGDQPEKIRFELEG